MNGFSMERAVRDNWNETVATDRSGGAEALFRSGTRDMQVPYTLRGGGNLDGRPNRALRRGFAAAYGRIFRRVDV